MVIISNIGMQKYDDEAANPHFRLGLVSEIESDSDDLPVIVKWSNGEINHYEYEDLQAIK